MDKEKVEKAVVFTNWYNRNIKPLTPSARAAVRRGWKEVEDFLHREFAISPSTSPTEMMAELERVAAEYPITKDLLKLGVEGVVMDYE